MELQHLPLHLIDRPNEPDRLDISAESVVSLTNSIRDDGLIQPIVVRPIIGDRYELVAGDRRLRAIQSLNWDTIPAIIRHDVELGNRTARLAENLHRENLTPMEEAIAVDRLARESKLNSTQIAHVLNRSDTWVAKRRALLALPTNLKELVHTREIPIETALYLARVTDEAHRNHLLEYTIRSGASTEVIRSWVNEWQTAVDAGTVDAAPKPELPPAGQPVIVMVPCFACDKPTPHLEMVIVRLCKGCHTELGP